MAAESEVSFPDNLDGSALRIGVLEDSTLIARRIGLAEALATAPQILGGSIRGRLVVDVRQ